MKSPNTKQNSTVVQLCSNACTNNVRELVASLFKYLRQLHSKITTQKRVSNRAENYDRILCNVTVCGTRASETDSKVFEELSVFKKAEVVFFKMSVPLIRMYVFHMQVDSQF